MLPGMAYLVRRLLENTSNESFLKASFAGGARGRRPAARPRGGRSHVGPRSRDRAETPSRRRDLPPFRNEPLTDFTRPENRERDARRRSTRSAAGSARSYPIRIGGRDARRRPRRSTSTDPGDSAAGRRPVRPRPTPRHAERGRRGGPARPSPAWSATPAASARGGPGPGRGDHAAPTVRAGRLGGLRVRQALARGRRRRRRGDRLLRVLRPRDDPPGRARRTATSRARRTPSSTSPGASPSSSPPGTSRWRSRCGMTVAALVAGNTVVLKPAEQSPVIACAPRRDPPRGRPARRAS